MRSRAVHMEMAHTAVASTQIPSLMRYVDLSVIEDQGTNFVGTQRKLKEAVTKISTEMLQHN